MHGSIVEYVAVVAPDPRVWDPLGRELGDLSRRLERSGEHKYKRDEKEHAAGDQDDVLSLSRPVVAVERWEDIGYLLGALALLRLLAAPLRLRLILGFS